jgi:L-lactate dehydrogenase complex protein LldE
MHIGSTLARLGSQTRPVHLAEILASTEEHPYALHAAEGIR